MVVKEMLLTTGLVWFSVGERWLPTFFEFHFFCPKTSLEKLYIMYIGSGYLKNETGQNGSKWLTAVETHLRGCPQAQWTGL